ncbi:MAG: response regulator [Pseudobacteriovorax sp.]|nr:response regulator [Pseudobacteriovorax sp.]
MVPSFERIAKAKARELSFFLSLAVTTVFFGICAYILKISIVDSVRNSFKASQTFLINSINIGNSFALESQLESLVNEQFLAVNIYYIKSGKKQLFLSKPLDHKTVSSDFPLIIYQSKISYQATYRIAESNGYVFYINLIKPIDIWLYILLLGILSLILFFICCYIHKGFGNLALTFSNPVGKLIHKVRNQELNLSKEALVHDLKFEETMQLYETFRNQWHLLMENEKEIRSHAKDKAIAQTTQMLAHDVRKPFSMIQALIDIVSTTDDIREAQATLTKSLPTISNAMTSVNGMIQDIMDVGSTASMQLEEIDLESIVDSALRNQFAFTPNDSIDITYHLDLTRKVSVDVLKIARVFSNIIGNAVQHMNATGRIWVYAVEKDHYCEVCIGNSDTYIDANDIPLLFDAFYTRNKKGGTGLGLAIAKKIVNAHDGKIWCESDQLRGTEFFFTLPLTNASSTKVEKTKRNSSEYLQKTSFQIPAEDFVPPKAASIDDDLINKLKARIATHKSPITVAVLDDEDIYIQTIRNQIHALGIIQDINFLSFQSFKDFKSILTNSVDLAIIDVDLGPKRLNGFEVTEDLRKRGFTATICIHSNRAALEYQPKALASGANFFLPKPMTKQNIIYLLLSILGQQAKNKVVAEEILLFEDESIFQRQWKRVIGKDKVEIYKGWSEFEEHKQETFDWSRYKYVVVDYYLLDGETGIDVARKLRDHSCDLEIYMSSSRSALPPDSGDLIAKLVSKDPREAISEIKLHRA